ncbi:MAG TPA: hypothetical protein VG052_11620, partial [Puia sp.]|nr:hypothetical protein [Puia sp.]
MEKRLLLKNCLRQLILLAFALMIHGTTPAQSHANNLVFVDKQGILRWTKNNAEASFWGVNYTVP